MLALFVSYSCWAFHDLCQRSPPRSLTGISHRLPKDKRPQECGRGRHECLRHSPMRQTVLDDVAQALVPNATYFFASAATKTFQTSFVSTLPPTEMARLQLALV